MEDFTDVLAREKKTQENDSSSSSAAFKKPVLIGKRPGNIAKPKTAPKITTEEKPVEKTIESDKPPAKSNIQVEVPYKEPAWSGLCDKDYSLEILKTGTIVATQDLTKKPFIVFGRLSNCDIVLEHPSSSRFHAVLQYRSEAEDSSKVGWYLYDFGSTHGTFLNKKQLQPKIYYRTRVGHVIKFGCSTRLYILQGPEEDQETESELSVSELMEMKKKKEEAMKKLEEEEEENDKEEENQKTQKVQTRDVEKEGINWGMAEDAADENPTAENPFATDLNEELYLEDPKKTLRGWFEREGQELEYKVEERGMAHFICRVELPAETSTGQALIAEAVVKGGKKKEAVVQCALEACRMLDRLGLLRQSTHEGRQRKKRRYEDDDYYSSDEDTFLDRTGTIEKKRAARMKTAGVLGEEVDTYETLMEKYENLKKEMGQLQREIDEAAAKAERASKTSEADDDSLDAYMDQLTKQDSSKKKSTGKLKVKLIQLQKDEVRLKKLITLAKPANLPEIPKPLATQSSEPEKPVQEVVPKPNPEPKADPEPKEPKEKPMLNQANPSARTAVETKPRKQSAKVAGPLLTPEVLEQLRTHDPEEAEMNEPEVTKKKPEVTSDEPKSGLVVRRKENEKQKKSKAKDTSKNQAEKMDIAVEYDAADTTKYSMWMPPDDQSGDGKTSLNKKLGY
nr:EOG090X026V [Eulimnadia texana]